VQAAADGINIGAETEDLFGAADAMD